MQEKSRLAVLEDHLMVVEGMRFQLNNWGFDEMDHFEVGADLMSALSRGEQYDMLIMDLGVPKTDPHVVISNIMREYPDFKILILSGSKQSSMAFQFIKMGVKGFVSKEAGNDEIALAINLVRKGRSYIDSRLSIQKLGEQENPFAKLTSRESQVCEMLLQGMSYQDIAADLYIEVNTVGSFRTRIARKLGVKTLDDLKSLALRHGHSL